MRRFVDNISDGMSNELERFLNERFHEEFYGIYFKIKELLDALGDDPQIKSEINRIELEYFEYRRQRDLVAYQAGAAVSSGILTGYSNRDTDCC